MRLRDFTICFLCLILAVALFIGAGMQLDYINSQRDKWNLTINKPLENAPPSLAFATVAMGAFRGLVVDALWIRADRLKEEGQFFDAKQIAEWITTLQPRFGSVWTFQAWNMAYNISAAIPQTQPEQRWQWVRNGYELLRDEGIPLNPRDIKLYRQLALIFQHKIGGVTDGAHKYYKMQLARAITGLLGPADYEYFKQLADAPAEWRQIAADPDVAGFIKALKSADKTFADDKTFVSNYLSLMENPARFSGKAWLVITDFRETDALEKFDIFARAEQLRNVWKLDPVFMQQLNTEYGPINWDDPNKVLPLDWRHPDTHAIYWALKGLEQSKDMKRSALQIHTNRLVMHSLQNLFRYGRIFIYNRPFSKTTALSPRDSDEFSSGIFLRQDLRMFHPYNKMAMKVLGFYKEIEKKSIYKSLQDGHRNMMINAMFSFYQSGHKKEALKIYNQLRKLYPRDEFKVSLELFAKKRLKDELRNVTVTNAREIIQAMLREAYFRYAMRDDDESANRENLAKQIYGYYQSSYTDENRTDLPDFKMMKYLSLLDFVNDKQYSVELRQSLINRIKIERPELAEQLKRQEQEMLRQTRRQK